MEFTAVPKFADLTVFLYGHNIGLYLVAVLSAVSDFQKNHQRMKVNAENLRPG
jgi:hypothetical protein